MRSRPIRSGTGAFTLVEVLIAVVLLGIAVLLVQASFSTLMNSLASARENAEISRTAESIIWFMSSELNNAVIAPGLEFSGAGADGAAEIYFYSTSAYPGAGTKDLFSVSYRSEEGDLWKGVDGDYFRAAGGLESLGIRYYDGYEWLDEWDSAVSGRLPRAAEIRIGIGGRRFSRIVSLPVNAGTFGFQGETGL